MFRRFIFRLSASMFGTFALLFASLTAILLTFGSSTPIKRALNDSHIYNTLGSSFTQQQAGNQSLGNTPEVQQAAQAAATPDEAKKATEQFVDGTYHWLDGTTKEPDFKVDLTKPVQAFLNSLRDSAATKAKTLPVCTAEQLQNINLNTISIDSLSCLPPGVDTNRLSQQTVDQAAAGNSLLKNPIITADSLPRNKQGQTFFEQAYIAPGLFKLVTYMAPACGLLALVFAAIVFALRRNWRAGLRTVSISLLTGSIVLLVGGFVINYAFSLLSKQQSSPDGLMSSVNTLIGILAHDVTKTIFIFASSYMLAAIAGLVAVHVTKPKPPAVATTAIADSDGTPPATTRPLTTNVPSEVYTRYS